MKVESDPRTVYEICKMARRLLANPEDWSRVTYPIDTAGRVENCPVVAPCQIKFSLAGALNISSKIVCPTRASTMFAFYGLFDEREYGVHPPLLHEINDDPQTTHDDVLTALDWAIGVAEAGGL